MSGNTLAIGSHTSWVYSYPFGFNEDVLIENWKDYVIDGNAKDLKDAKVTVLLEHHKDPINRIFNEKILNNFPKKGDTVFPEDWANFPSNQLRYVPRMTEEKKKDITFQGWLCPEAKIVYETFIEQNVNPLKVSYSLVERQLSSFTHDDFPLFEPMFQQLTKLKETIQKKQQNYIDYISLRLIPSNQKSLISFVTSWLQNNLFTPHCLYILGGRYHGNRHLEENPFKNEVSQLLNVLHQTDFLIIDFHKKVHYSL